MADKRVWKKIRAAYEAGETGLVGLSKKFGVPIKDIFSRIKAEGWSKQADDPPAEPGPMVPAVWNPEEQIGFDKDSQANESRDQINQSHKTISRTQRELYEDRMRDYQAMLLRLVRFDDEETLSKFTEENDTKGLIEYLMSAFKAQAAANQMFEQLVRVGNQIIDRERATHKLDEKGADDSDQEQWEELLAQVKAPPKPRPLPANVVKFDRLMGGG